MDKPRYLIGVGLAIALALAPLTPTAAQGDEPKVYRDVDPDVVPAPGGSSCTTGEAEIDENRNSEDASCTFTCEPQSDVSVSGWTPDGDPEITVEATCPADDDVVASCSGNGACQGSGVYDDATPVTGKCYVEAQGDPGESGKAHCSSDGIGGRVYINIATETTR